jgi:hypothetical protein
MNKSFTQALGFCAALLMLVTACKKDEVRTTLIPSNSPTLTASTTTAVLAQANETQTAVTFTWTPVKSLSLSDNTTTLPSLTYYLQFDKKGNNFSSPVSIDAGTASTTGTTTTTAVTVGNLNNAMTKLGLVPATATDVEVRLNASYAANGGTYSNVLPLNVTAYKGCPQPAAANAWGIIGAAAKGWGDNDDIVMTYDCTNNVYTYTGAFKADEYKFRYGGNDATTGKWKANLGGTTGTTSTGGALVQDGSNLKIATAGTYTITLKPAALDAAGKATAGSTFTVK